MRVLNSSVCSSIPTSLRLSSLTRSASVASSLLGPTCCESLALYMSAWTLQSLAADSVSFTLFSRASMRSMLPALRSCVEWAWMGAGEADDNYPFKLKQVQILSHAAHSDDEGTLLLDSQ